MRLTHAAALALLFAGSAVAQTSLTTSTVKSAATAKPARAPVVRTAKSLECSKQADTKGLHGKPRKSFMSSCKKA